MRTVIAFMVLEDLEPWGWLDGQESIMVLHVPCLL